MSLGVPSISIIIGEGGSGGAIALASTNKVLMLENAIYSVISPEGCASILWRDPKKTLEAATAMKLTSKDLLKLKIIDEIILEPNGGAHRDKNLILSSVKESIQKNIDYLSTKSREEIITLKKEKFLNIGRDKGLSNNILSSDKLFTKNTLNILKSGKLVLSKKKYFIFTILLLLVLTLTYLN